MKMTLLEMAQDISNDIDGDEFNSIADTIESMQIAQIIKTCFYEIITRKEWPHLRQMTTLENVSDPLRPTHLRLPERVVRLDYLAYNQKKELDERDRFHEVHYLHADEFIRHTNARNTDNDNVIAVPGFNGIKVNVLNDQPPQYWTSFDDNYIVFDAWVSIVTTTMLGSESQAQMYYTPSWEMIDDFIPDLPVEAFPALLSEAKSAASLKLRQIADDKAEQQSRRQNYMLAQRGWRAHGGIRYPNYGRRGSKMYQNKNPLFDRNSYTGGKS